MYTFFVIGHKGTAFFRYMQTGCQKNLYFCVTALLPKQNKKRKPIKKTRIIRGDYKSMKSDPFGPLSCISELYAKHF